jgi:predicted regulator of Ras-like GTPase activity (Roadblock/LC7/MglB family)
VKEILEPLARIPGVRTAALVTSDGVPIAVKGKVGKGKEMLEERDWVDSAEDLDALAGLAAGWMGEIKRAVAPLSWHSPRRMTLRATHGTLVMLQTHGAVLLVVLNRGMRAEELRLPMEAAEARMQRILRGMGDKKARPEPTDDVESAPAIFPRSLRLVRPEPDGVEVTGNGAPTTSGD